MTCLAWGAGLVALVGAIILIWLSTKNLDEKEEQNKLKSYLRWTALGMGAVAILSGVAIYYSMGKNHGFQTENEERGSENEYEVEDKPQP